MYTYILHIYVLYVLYAYIYIFFFWELKLSNISQNIALIMREINRDGDRQILVSERFKISIFYFPWVKKRHREFHCTQEHQTLLRGSLWSCLGIPLAVPGKTPHQNVWVHYPSWKPKESTAAIYKRLPTSEKWVLNEHLQFAQSLTSGRSIWASPGAKHMLIQGIVNE